MCAWCRYDHNLLRPLAKSISKQSYLLCFDEIQIPDIGTAAILYKLFEYLNEYGVVVVSTSNRAPNQLYQGHFNETVFSPWVDMMADRWDVVEMESANDYRRQMADAVVDSPFKAGNTLSDCYFQPLGQESTEKMDQTWDEVTEGAGTVSKAMEVMGRLIEIPTCTENGIARFKFDELCSRPLGPADYLTIARTFHTVFIDSIPRLDMSKRNEARRFISLIDALYECKSKLYCDAEQLPDQMFIEATDTDLMRYDAMHREMFGEMTYDMSMGDDSYAGKVFHNRLFTGEEELFASKRCVSRLLEMRSPIYRTSAHAPGFGFAGFDTDCLEFGDATLGGHATEPGTPATAATSDKHTGKAPQPSFGEKHFWGAGWWETVVNKVTGGRAPRPWRGGG